ncbi:MAG: hypothetical protein K0S71_1017 [Clostridia bacterium]|nr:hypothetical protein [Clostridia bacterium]
MVCQNNIIVYKMSVVKIDINLYHTHFILITAGLEGFEPSSAGIKILCLTAWQQPTIRIHRDSNPGPTP